LNKAKSYKKCEENRIRNEEKRQSKSQSVKFVMTPEKTRIEIETKKDHEQLSPLDRAFLEKVCEGKLEGRKTGDGYVFVAEQ
jgi:hypothetical protein